MHLQRNLILKKTYTSKFLISIIMLRVLCLQREVEGAGLVQPGEVSDETLL